MRTSIERASVVTGGNLYRGFNRLFERIAGMELQHLEIDGARVPFWQAGTGPAVLMMHGFADSKETWLGVIPALSRRYTLIIPDLPGYGDATCSDPSQTSVEGLADVMLKLLDRLGRRRVHLIGSSMGGGVALRMAADAPQRIKTLTLLCTLGPMVELSKMGKMLGEGRNILLPESRREWDEMMDTIFVRRPPPLRLGQVCAFMAAKHVAARSRFTAQFDAMMGVAADYGLEHDWSCLETPTLLVHGESDKIIHCATSVSLAEALPNAELMLLENVGHAPHWEAFGRWRGAWERLVSQSSREG